jgi:hypothetical protein
LKIETTVKPEDQGNWQLETRKHRHGRVHSITLKRVDEPETQAEEGALIDSHFDIPPSPVTKTVYSEQSTQTEDAPSEGQTTQAKVSSFVAQETQTDDEPFISFSTCDIKSQQTEPVDIVKADDDTKEEEGEISDEPQPTSPCCEKEHLCTACGEKFDYSSEDDEMEFKTPWQELCDDLVAFAVMKRE